MRYCVSVIWYITGMMYCLDWSTSFWLLSPFSWEISSFGFCFAALCLLTGPSARSGNSSDNNDNMLLSWIIIYSMFPFWPLETTWVLYWINHMSFWVNVGLVYSCLGCNFFSQLPLKLPVCCHKVWSHRFLLMFPL